ncbi:unnamed protein product [Spirodela intermedia]|uniref:RING-type E3 ubiquitin transferase n=1 Tax=Spirodela intermedia TaxID=51605 RepID=A0A7I8L0I2_SPIIN|nr:unnamed protein product [Spirodela intermedia]
MNLLRLLVFLFFLLSSSSCSVAQPQSEDSQQEVALAFKPSVAIVIGVFSIVFSLTFLLLVYAKFCHTVDAAPIGGDSENQFQSQFNGLLSPGSRFSGIDKSVIESLPFFRFSSLRGPKEGLECSVCLSRFEDAEILRLLPKCKHAFHIGCVDRWLESHSSCPLCRCKVEIEDATLFKYSTSSRFLFGNPPDRGGHLEEGDENGLYVERVPGEQAGASSGFTCGGSFRKTGKDEPLLPEVDKLLHKHMHKIILSDVVFKNRWSDLQSSDLISLKSEMLGVLSSKRFTEGSSNGGVHQTKDRGEESSSSESKSTGIDFSRPFPAPGIFPSSSGSDGNSNGFTSSSKSMIPSGDRSMSEIINISRFGDATRRRTGSEDNSDTTHNSRDEKMRRLWVPIARRTVQLFAGR